MSFLKKLFRFIFAIILVGALAVGGYCVLFGLNGIYGGGSSLEENVLRVASSTVSSISASINGYIPIESDGQLISDDDKASLEDNDTGPSGENYDFDEGNFYPYYEMLSEKGKAVYKKAYANAVEFNSSFIITNGIKTDEVQKAIEALFNDHPELFWLETKYNYLYTEGDICVQVSLEYNMTADQLPQAQVWFETAAVEIVNGAAAYGSDYEKEKFVHDTLAGSVEYDEEAPLSQSAYSALVARRSVCAGYARAFQYIMNRIGIPTYYVIGYSSGSHAWNIVKLDDGYYNVDVTWDASTPVSYRYFNRTDADFAETHTREDESCNLPQCTAEKYRGLESSPGLGLFNNIDNFFPSGRDDNTLPEPETYVPDPMPNNTFPGQFDGTAQGGHIIIY